MRESATERLAAEGQRFRIIYLSMEKWNQTARRFYRSMEFGEVCTIRSMYPHGDARVWSQSVAGNCSEHEGRTQEGMEERGLLDG